MRRVLSEKVAAYVAKDFVPCGSGEIRGSVGEDVFEKVYAEDYSCKYPKDIRFAESNEIKVYIVEKLLQTRGIGDSLGVRGEQDLKEVAYGEYGGYGKGGSHTYENEV